MALSLGAQRAAGLVLGVGAVALAAYLAINAAPPIPKVGIGDGGRTASDDGGAFGTSIATSAGDVADAASALALTAAIDAGDPLLDDLGATGPDTRSSAGVGGKMPDGSPVPPLGDKAPKSVRFGVIMVTYAGAQGAPPNARSKKDAQDLARTVAAEAKTDFHAASAKGDSGSSEDLGHVPRGVLELYPEYVLFSLPPKGVSDAIDTPKGFWIMQRIE